MVENMLPHTFVILTVDVPILVKKFGAANVIIWFRAKIHGLKKKRMDMA
jgi:hypothetical protein